MIINGKYSKIPRTRLTPTPTNWNKSDFPWFATILSVFLLELLGIKTRPTLGDRAFQSAAPYLSNALPSTIRNIKTLDTFKTAV